MCNPNARVPLLSGHAPNMHPNPQARSALPPMPSVATNLPSTPWHCPRTSHAPPTHLSYTRPMHLSRASHAPPMHLQRTRHAHPVRIPCVTHAPATHLRCAETDSPPGFHAPPMRTRPRLPSPPASRVGNPMYLPPTYTTDPQVVGKRAQLALPRTGPHRRGRCLLRRLHSEHHEALRGEQAGGGRPRRR